MVFHERGAWSGLIAAFVAAGAYIWLVQGADAWIWPMLWSVAIVIAVTLGWGLIVGIRDREGATATDLRDRDISRLGGRVESVALAAGGVAVIGLCAAGAETFWIANVMFAGFVLAAVAGDLARVIAYRRDLA